MQVERGKIGNPEYGEPPGKLMLLDGGTGEGIQECLAERCLVLSFMSPDDLPPEHGLPVLLDSGFPAFDEFRAVDHILVESLGNPL